jgi:hypothetical protein
VREHRLYQADWLMRFYGFAANEIVEERAGTPRSASPTSRGFISPKTRRCLSSFSATTARPRICSTARSWSGGFVARRSNWGLDSSVIARSPRQNCEAILRWSDEAIHLCR